MENRIAEHRLRVGMSMAALGDRLGLTRSAINKLEKGISKISYTRAREMAAIFSVQVGDVVPEYAPDVGFTSPAGFSAPRMGYSAGASMPRVEVVTGSDLDQAGILPGDVLTLEPVETLAELRSGDIIALEASDGVLFRQFIEPAQAITNSSGGSDIVNLRASPYRLIGVMVELRRTPIRGGRSEP